MIRRSKNEDLEAIMQLWLVATLQSHDFIAAEFWWKHQQQISTQYLDKAEIWLDENNGEIKGFFAINNRTLSALFVHPLQQESNLKLQLLQKAKSLRSKLKLHIYSEDEDAIRFYSSNGFCIIKQQIETISGQPELVMAYRQDAKSKKVLVA